MTTIKTALQHGLFILQKTSPSARVDAEILLLTILNTTRSYLYTHPESSIEPTQWQQYQHLIQQRGIGHPIAHLTGAKEFWSLPLKVTKDTLIPRPETELLIELALKFLKDQEEISILDLGTGSGAIALALASERPSWNIQAYDICEKALHVAKQNAQAFNLPHIYFGHSNWFKAIPAQSFHAIISNPPYIAEGDTHLQQGDVRFEPDHALTSGIKGLDALTEIIKTAITYLHPAGFLLVEHGFDQKDAVSALFHQFGYTNIQTFKDLEGNDRVTCGFNAKV